MKKTILIIGILVIVALAAYLIFGSNQSTQTTDTGGGFSIRDFLPFGKGGESINAPTGGLETTSTNNEPSQTNTIETVKRLRKISTEPTAGGVAFNIGTTTFVRWVEKGTGNVYEANSKTNKIDRLTNTTIPKIVRVYWLPNGSGFLAQTILPETEIVETSFVKLNKTKATSTETLTPYETVISKLPTDIKEISIRPDGVKIFYYQISKTGSEWYISNPDGTGSSKVLSHLLIEWKPSWVSTTTIYMQTKPSSGSLGYLYSFDTGTKSLKSLVGSIAGLSTIGTSKHPSIVFSSGGSIPSLNYMNLKESSSFPLSQPTLADKCAWPHKDVNFVFCGVPNSRTGGNFPDQWYMGVVSTEDSIIKSDVGNATYFVISNLSEESGESIDVYDMQISPDDSHIIFKNKKDGYLWMLRVGD